MEKSDGTVFWVHLAATVAQGADGAPVCRTTLTDITERKLTEQALIETEEKYRVVFNKEICAISIFDLETLTILDVNMLGYSPDKFLHYKDFMALVHLDDYDSAMNARKGHFT